MPNILYLPNGEMPSLVDLFPTDPAQQPWNETIVGPWDDLVSRFDVVVTCDTGGPINLIGNNSRSVAIIYRSMEALAAAEPSSNLTHIFTPNKLAILDAMRNRRETLVFASSLPAATRITDDNLTIRHGGTGIAAELKEAMIGRKLIYDVREGQAVDFGQTN